MDAVAQPALVAVGEVLRPWGLAGEVRVKPLTDRPEERFRQLRECVLWEPAVDRREDCRITGCRFDGEELFVRMEGVTSPEAAKRFSGRLLAVAREDALPAPEGSFYPWEMAGAVVETRDGRRVGEFVGVDDNSAQPLWIVTDQGREHLVPAVPEIVVDVNVAERRIVIDPPEGLLDL
ncbi:MAG TPA: ribosome maturation factor RimM [Methylomirabilota bacterium]